MLVIARRGQCAKHADVGSDLQLSAIAHVFLFDTATPEPACD
jgi:hypothetical protein